MAVPQKARITTYFGLPKEVHGAEDVTEKRCDKQSDQSECVTTPTRKEVEDGSCVPYSDSLEDGVNCEPYRGESQQPRRKQVVNLFGGLLGQDVTKKKSCRSEGRSRAAAETSFGSEESPDLYSSGRKDSHCLDLASWVMEGCQKPSTVVNTPEKSHAASRSAQEDHINNMRENVHSLLLAGSYPLGGEGDGTSCNATRRQTMLSFDKAGKLAVELSSCHSSLLIEADKDQGDTVGTQRIVSTKQEDSEKGPNMVGATDQCQGPWTRRRKAKCGEEEEDTQMVDLSRKKQPKVIKESVLVIKEDQMRREGQKEPACKDVLVREREKKAVKGSQKRAENVKDHDGDCKPNIPGVCSVKGETAMEAEECVGETSDLILDKTGDEGGRDEGTKAEHFKSMSERDQMQHGKRRSHRKEQSRSQGISSRLRLSRRKNHCSSEREESDVSSRKRSRLMNERGLEIEDSSVEYESTAGMSQKRNLEEVLVTPLCSEEATSPVCVSSVEKSRHPSGRTGCIPAVTEDEDVVVTSSDEGHCTAAMNHEEEVLVSEATPLHSSWVGVHTILDQKDNRNIRVPSKSVSTPLNPLWSGIFKMPSENRQSEEAREKLSAGGQVSAACNSVSHLPGSSPAPGWIRSPYLDSPSNFSPSPLCQSQGTKSTELTAMDHFPFSDVVHIQQRNPNEPFWNLQLPDSLHILPHCTNPVPIVPKGPFSMTISHLSNAVAPSQKTISGAVEQEHLLREMERANPSLNIRALYARYSSLTRHTGGRKSSVEVLSTHTESSREAAGRKKCGELIVTIKVLPTEEVVSRRIVIDRTAYRPPHKKSLRLSKTRSSNVKCENENTENKKVASSCSPMPPAQDSGDQCESSRSIETASSDLWSEHYQPVQASEVLGNTPQVQELYQWLARWKEKASAQRVASGDTAATKPAKLPLTAGRPPAACHSEDSDDDFVVTTHRRPCSAGYGANSDSELSSTDDSNSLCPVVLLCGPHGAGKTAAILACAQELGFKVFVIDSTTIRSRQTILSVLREATLSHQVTKQLSTTTDHHSTQAGGVAKSLPVATAKRTKPPVNNLMSFFKPQETPGGSKAKKGKHQKSNQRESNSTKDKYHSKSKLSPPCSVSETKVPPPQSSEIALVAATVIVLEEVDILFEDEKGFWSAVYEIIASTKRPIVMTSNADLSLDSEHLKIVFSSPPPDELAGHIQTLCLAHGTVLSHSEAKQLAVYLGCDTRKVLNTLQCWLSALSPQKRPSSSEKAQNGYFGSAASVSIDQLLGLSYQQSCLLKHILCSSVSIPAPFAELNTLSHDAASILSEAIQSVHSGQLSVNICMSSSDQWNVSCQRADLASENMTKSHHGTMEVVAKRPHYVSFPWRAQHGVHKRCLHPPSCLNLVADFLDTMCDVDMLNCKDPWRKGLVDLGHPWWVTENSNGRQLCTAHSEQAINSGITTTLEGLALAAVADVSHDNECTTCNHDQYGLLGSPSHERHYEVIHAGQMQCCEVFDAQTEMSRKALVVDCLPVLHLLCQSENTRETASSHRRFRHYLQSSTVDISHLKSFAKTATLHSTPDMAHSLP